MGTKSQITQEERRRIIKRGRNKCFFCRTKNRFLLNIDHKIPLSRGGKDSIENMIPTCSICNVLKADLMPEEFIEFLQALNKLSELHKIHVKQINPEIKMKAMNQINPKVLTAKDWKKIKEKRELERETTD